MIERERDRKTDITGGRRKRTVRERERGGVGETKMT